MLPNYQKLPKVLPKLLAPDFLQIVKHWSRRLYTISVTWTCLEGRRIMSKQAELISRVSLLIFKTIYIKENDSPTWFNLPLKHLFQRISLSSVQGISYNYLLCLSEHMVHAQRQMISSFVHSDISQRPVVSLF